VTSRDTFAEEHVSGAINMPSLANLATHSGAVLPYDRPLVVLCEPGQADAVTRKFRNVGLFNVEGWLPRNEAMAQAETSTTLSLDALQAAQAIRDGAIPLDVRSASEFSEGHLDEAVHRHYAGLAHTAADLSKDAKYVTYCGSGIRASIAASILQSGGYDVAAGGGFSALDAEL
jgi:hydroxyacylglutathione hydrolase